MGVSKIAVIALVAVIAIPILLGYAFNLQQVTETDYRTTGDPVNVTPLLKNGTGYSYAHGNTYQLNSKFGVNVNPPILPMYETYTAAATSLAANLYKPSNNFYPPGSNAFDSFDLYFWQFTYDVNVCQLNITIHKNDNTTVYVTNIHTVYFDYATNLVKITRYTGTDTIAFSSYDDVFYIDYSVTGAWSADSYNIYNWAGGYGSYVDISGGYYFTGVPDAWSIKLPQNTYSLLVTMDLNSITDSTYSVKIGAVASSYTLEKSTVGGQVSWLLRDNTDPTRTIDLYYDQTRSSNTYQIYWDLTQTSQDASYIYYTSHREFRYIGDWPTTIGEANYYMNFTDDSNTRAPVGTPISIDSFDLYQSSNDRSPKVRADDAYFRAFEYSVIKDQTYIPSNFKSNPVTTISDITVYGTSFTFGGNTYTVSKDGKISLNSHDIPVENMQLSSVPNENGTYDNRIGNTIISTTAQPSSIVFNGSWSASISTQAMESYTYTKTEWVAGEFAWDGIDHNFLIVGLITCLGVFIGCGIYARRSRSGGIIPLMIITGCAAFVFFIML